MRTNLSIESKEMFDKKYVSYYNKRKIEQGLKTGTKRKQHLKGAARKTYQRKTHNGVPHDVYWRNTFAEIVAQAKEQKWFNQLGRALGKSSATPLNVLLKSKKTKLLNNIFCHP